MAVKGVDVLIMANTGTDVSPVWAAVGGQRNATLHEEVATIDVTTKASPNGMQEFEYGLGTWTISCDGAYIPDDTAYITLQTAMRNKTKVKVRVKEAGSYTAEGLALIISRDIEAPYEKDATYKMELQGTGALTPNPV